MFNFFYSIVQNEVYKQKKTQNSEEDERHSSERTVSDASSNASVNTQELEEKIKKLKEEFPRSPRVLIKKTLCSDDVQCDLVKAKIFTNGRSISQESCGNWVHLRQLKQRSADEQRETSFRFVNNEKSCYVSTGDHIF